VFKQLVALSDVDFERCLPRQAHGTSECRSGGRNSSDPAARSRFTSGVLAQEPIPGTAAFSLVNSGLEETLAALKMGPPNGPPTAEVAKAHVRSVENDVTGLIIDAKKKALTQSLNQASPEYGFQRRRRGGSLAGATPDVAPRSDARQLDNATPEIRAHSASSSSWIFTSRASGFGALSLW
jgi:hypothetical protein